MTWAYVPREGSQALVAVTTLSILTNFIVSSTNL
jgi:hypothetical protein